MSLNHAASSALEGLGAIPHRWVAECDADGANALRAGPRGLPCGTRSGDGFVAAPSLATCKRPGSDADRVGYHLCGGAARPPRGPGGVPAGAYEAVNVIACVCMCLHCH